MINAFVIGHPIAHSKSPLIHGTWLNALGIAGSYRAFDVPPQALGAFIDRVRDGEFVGGNVTIPHKENVMALLDSVDPLASTIGAVNTIVTENGRLIGKNTDYLGFLANLDAGAPGWSDRGGTAIVIGAGGAARAVLAGLIDRGVGRIDLLNRTLGRAEALAAEFGTTIVPGPIDRFNALAPAATLLVNTSSVGMGGSGFDAFDLDRLDPRAVVTDIVYSPLITKLLADAQAKGFATVDGLGMLLHQAVPGFQAWFGVRPEVDAALRAKILGQQ